jgi:glycosyltransferase involved in cell wall biosynthesis
MKKLTIVSPVFNEKETINEFFDKLLEVKEEVERKHREINVSILLINDGSSDGTFDNAFQSADVIHLIKNYGHQVALWAGLNHAKESDYIIVLDSDLQDPPIYIIELLEKMLENFSVVLTYRKTRKDSALKRTMAYIYYRILRLIFGANIVLDSGDYWGVDSRALKMLLNNKRHTKFFRGELANLGLRTTLVPIHRDKRFGGKTKYNLTKMLNLAVAGITEQGQSVIQVFFRITLIYTVCMSILLTILIFEKQNAHLISATILILLIYVTNLLYVISIFLNKIIVEIEGNTDYVLEEISEKLLENEDR